VTGPATGAEARPSRAEAAAAAQSRPVLAREDLERIRKALLSGDVTVASRSDLGQLNKSIARMFETLNAGLGESAAQKAEADRRALEARLERVEEALNGMEGALRIEILPELERSVRTAVSTRGAGPRGRAPALLSVGVALVLGIALGVALAPRMPLPIEASSFRLAAENPQSGRTGPHLGAASPPGMPSPVTTPEAFASEASRFRPAE